MIWLCVFNMSLSHVSTPAAANKYHVMVEGVNIMGLKDGNYSPLSIKCSFYAVLLVVATGISRYF
jgi:hypothetical protein